MFASLEAAYGRVKVGTRVSRSETEDETSPLEAAGRRLTLPEASQKKILPDLPELSITLVKEA